MKKIRNIHKLKTNDKLYYSEQKSDNIIYHIFTLNNIIDDEINNINCFSFVVPNNSNLKAFLYDDCGKITINQIDSLYKLTESEYLNTYLVFMKNDGKYVYELPAKLIQDI